MRINIENNIFQRLAVILLLTIISVSSNVQACTPTKPYVPYISKVELSSDPHLLILTFYFGGESIGARVLNTQTMKLTDSEVQPNDKYLAGFSRQPYFSNFTTSGDYTNWSLFHDNQTLFMKRTIPDIFQNTQSHGFIIDMENFVYLIYISTDWNYKLYVFSLTDPNYVYFDSNSSLARTISRSFIINYYENTNTIRVNAHSTNCDIYYYYKLQNNSLITIDTLKSGDKEIINRNTTQLILHRLPETNNSKIVFINMLDRSKTEFKITHTEINDIFSSNLTQARLFYPILYISLFLLILSLMRRKRN